MNREVKTIIGLEETGRVRLEGLHNVQLQEAAARVKKGKGFRDLSTLIVIPSRDLWYPRVVMSWFAMMLPMNQKVARFPIIGSEIGEAYSNFVSMVLEHSELRTWKYMLTLETDNIPPADGLLKLYESIDDYDAVSGLYFTKGPGGQPMIYGDPMTPLNFYPQIPQPNSVQRCNGLGMGFTLFNIKMFKDPKLSKPFFKTQQEVVPGKGVCAYTQDLYFFEQAARAGYKFAVDTRVAVGHYSFEEDMVW